LSSRLAQRSSARAAVFADIGEVATVERRRIATARDEPDEIKLLRAQVAQDAQAMVAEAVAAAEMLRIQAREEGYAEGRKAGYEDARAACIAEFERSQQEWKQDIAALMALIERERRQMWLDAEAQIVHFVLEIAQKVVKDEASLNREVAVSVVRNALRRVVDTGKVRVRVNAEDLETVRASREELATLIDGIENLEIISDRRVGAGGAVVQTEGGTIDARIETQLSEIATLLNELTDEAA